MVEFLNIIFDSTADFINFLIRYDYSRIIYWLKILAAFSSALFVCGIAYSVYKTNKILKAMRVFDEPESVPVDKNKNLEEWQKISAKGSSESENDRKLALIAADSLIEKILALAGYSGENLGERLKNIESSDLDSLQDLWEAHKIRNRIAHEADYKLSREEALRALALYEKAFRELEYI